MAKNVVEFTLRAKDQVTRVLSSIGGGIASFAKGLLNQGANIKAWGEMIAGSVKQTFGRVWGAVQEAFKFESLETQFKTLLGSMDAAKGRMQMLAKVAEETPFDMEGVVKANRILTVMSKDALGTEWALKLVGDTAAAVGGNVDEMAMWIGRAYAMIQAGKPFGEAAMRLTELGALTPEVRQKMEDLQAAGASNSEVWDALVAHLEGFGGAMKDLSKTGEGMMSTLEDNWTAAVREFGQAFMDSAKDSIGFLINKLAELQASGAITEWAEKAKEALEPVRNLIIGILGNSDSRAKAFGAAWDYLKEVAGYVADTLKNAIIYAGDYLESKAMDIKAQMMGKLGDHELGGQMREAAANRYRLAQMKAGLELSQATGAMKAAFAQAAEEGKKAVEENITKAAAKKEDEEAKKKRLEAEKAKASAAVAGTGPTPAELKAKEEAEKKAIEAQKEAIKGEIDRTKKSIETTKAEIEALKEREKKAKEELKEARKRSLDANYEKEERQKKLREERQKKREDERLQKRAERLAARFKTLTKSGTDVLLDENFDTKKLTHSERALREFMIKQKTAEDLTNKLAADSIGVQMEIRARLEDIYRLEQQLLTLK